MAENDENYRTFVHIAQKIAENSLKIFFINPRFALELNEQMCYNVHRKEEQYIKTNTDTACAR